MTGRGSARYFCYCHRRAVPPEFAQHCRAVADDRPGDVVLLVKSSLASPELQQPVVTLCRAGVSWKLGPAPSAWLPRMLFDAVYVNKLRKLGDQIVKHFPARTKVIAHLNAWLRAPRVPDTPPPTPHLLNLPDDWNLGLWTPDDASRATQAMSDAVAGVRVVGVHRKRAAGHASGWRREAKLVSDLPLDMYIAYRRSVGDSREAAEAEWRSARQVCAIAGG